MFQFWTYYTHACYVASAVSNFSLWPHRVLCQWDFPGKNTRVGCVPFSRDSPDPGITRVSSVSCIGRQGRSILYTVCINRNRFFYRNLWNFLGHISGSRKFYSQSRSTRGTWDTPQELSFSLVSPRYLGITGPLSAGIFSFPRLGIWPSYPILPILRSKLARLILPFLIRLHIT